MKSGVPWEIPVQKRERTNNKLNRHMLSMPGFNPGATSVGGKCSHHCTTLAPHCHLWGVGTNTGTFDVHHALILKIMFSPLENEIRIFAPPRLISSIWNFINWPLWTEMIMKVNSLHNASWQRQKINFVQCTNICNLLKLTSDWHLLKLEAVIRKA